jgi:hypothetical protein
MGQCGLLLAISILHIAIDGPVFDWNSAAALDDAHKTPTPQCARDPPCPQQQARHSWSLTAHHDDTYA